MWVLLCYQHLRKKGFNTWAIDIAAIKLRCIYTSVLCDIAVICQHLMRFIIPARISTELAYMLYCCIDSLYRISSCKFTSLKIKWFVEINCMTEHELLWLSLNLKYEVKMCVICYQICACLCGYNFHNLG